jgi:(p)ppGpp synthase/HD superfamily hydrolase
MRSWPAVHDDLGVSGDTANQRYLDALAFAESRHRSAKQARKGTRFPYLVHPIRVAAILDGFGCSEDAVVAGFLHDTVEDAGATYDEIAASFGQQVAKLVEGASEPDKSAPWDVRKQHTIDRVKVEASAEVLDLTAADKLDNVRSLRETIEARGREKTWLIFNADEEKQRWYYITLAATLLARNAESPLMRTLMDEVAVAFPPTGASSSQRGVTASE